MLMPWGGRLEKCSGSEDWEPILLHAGYHCAYSHGVNRYYIADEHAELDSRFLPFDELLQRYRIFHAELIS